MWVCKAWCAWQRYAWHGCVLAAVACITLAYMAWMCPAWTCRKHDISSAVKINFWCLFKKNSIFFLLNLCRFKVGAQLKTKTNLPHIPKRKPIEWYHFCPMLVFVKRKLNSDALYTDYVYSLKTCRLSGDQFEDHEAKLACSLPHYLVCRLCTA